MFHVHSTFALELIALASGVALLLYVKNQEKLRSAWLNFTAWFVIIAASLFFLCSLFYSISYWNKGYFDMHRSMMMMNYMQQKNEMMDDKDMMRNHKNEMMDDKDMMRNHNMKKSKKNENHNMMGN